jgi:hypothetical protein
MSSSLANRAGVEFGCMKGKGLCVGRFALGSSSADCAGVEVCGLGTDSELLEEGRLAESFAGCCVRLCFVSPEALRKNRLQPSTRQGK